MAKKYLRSLDDMTELAAHHGGSCLSKRYRGNKALLKWQCKHDHIFLDSPNNMGSGHWCPVCRGNKKKTIEEMQKYARKMGENVSLRPIRAAGHR